MLLVGRLGSCLLALARGLLGSPLTGGANTGERILHAREVQLLRKLVTLGKIGGVLAAACIAVGREHAEVGIDDGGQAQRQEDAAKGKRQHDEHDRQDEHIARELIGSVSPAHELAVLVGKVLRVKGHGAVLSLLVGHEAHIERIVYIP